MARIGYARVSSAGQDYQLQIDRLARDGCAPIRAEKVTGAVREGRGELGAILDFIRDGDELVVVRLDRLARSTRDTLNIVAELEAKGASLRVLEPEISTGGDLGRIVITTLGMVAELERSFLRERQRAGIAAAKQRGAYRGRRKAATARATEVEVSGHAGVYWRAAKEAFALKAKIGPVKKTGSKAAGNRGKRAYAAQVAAEHASEEWPEVEANQHRYFNMPEKGGWGADVRSAFIVEWEIPILKRVIEMAGPELREIPRWQQYEAIESVLVAHAELEGTSISEAEIESARSRMDALTAKLERG